MQIQYCEMAFHLLGLGRRKEARHNLSVPVIVPLREAAKDDAIDLSETVSGMVRVASEEWES